MDEGRDQLLRQSYARAEAACSVRDFCYLDRRPDNANERNGEERIIEKQSLAVFPSILLLMLRVLRHRRVSF